MSEEIESESKTVCVNEDAFDEFFSNAIYNEDEYITLADIVSPTRGDSEPSSDLREVTSDNEVLSSNLDQQQEHVNTIPYCGIGTGNDACLENNEVLSSNLDQQQENVNTIPYCGIGTGNGACLENMLPHEPKEDHCVELPTTGEVNSASTPSPTKRICKKKSYYDDDEFSPCSKNKSKATKQKSNKHVKVQNTPLDTSLIVTVKKRGRKPKNQINSQVDQSSNVSDISNTSPNPLISPLPSDLKNIAKPGGGRRRGRPKKKTQNEALIESGSKISNELNSSQIQISANNMMMTKKKGRRGNPKLVKKNEDSSDMSEIVNSENICETFNNDTELEDILEGNKPSDKSSDVCFTERDNTVVTSSIPCNEKGDDAIINQLTEMFSDQKTDALEQGQIVSETQDKVEPKKDKPAIEVDNLDLIKPALNISKENTCLNKSTNKGGRKKNTSFKNTNEELNRDDAQESLNDKNNLDSNIETMLSDDTDGEDICLSKLKANMLSTDNDNTSAMGNDSIKVLTETSANESITSTDINMGNEKEANVKRIVKMPKLDDFEYNLDNIPNETENKEESVESLLVVNSSKRSIRKRKQMNYELDSDEDPFANIELSDDDEPKRFRKGKYNSDDEYIPSKERCNRITSESGSDVMELVELDSLPKKRKKYMKKDSSTLRKKGKKKEEVVTIECDLDNDISECSQSSLAKANENVSSSKWGTTNEFENFLAKKIANSNIKIKKCTDKQSMSITPLEIPVIDQNEPKKFVDDYCQTNVTDTKHVSSQTDTLYNIPMKDNVILSKEQSEKACEFLSNVVTTTVELGRLMTAKSEDFIKKKINTTHVTNTMKMDYCVQKSFLLFRLAKHNLDQMEEHLATQYEEFLKDNGLSKCREQPKELSPRRKPDENDSDCEIIETPVKTKSSKKSSAATFNPKTVFLNKELSIKIAKKPTEIEKKLNIPGRNAVWISDSVMLKKVNTSQSFLAQDSRNKRPPDNFIMAKIVTEFFTNYRRQETIAKIVNNFFNNWYQQEIFKVCSPFTSAYWFSVNQSCICNYFIINNEHIVEASMNTVNGENADNSDLSQTATSTNSNTHHSLKLKLNLLKPDSLLTLCTQNIQKIIFPEYNNSVRPDLYNHLEKGSSKKMPLTLFQLCILTLKLNLYPESKDLSHNAVLDDSELLASSVSKCASINDNSEEVQHVKVNMPLSLKKICLLTLKLNLYPESKDLSHNAVLDDSELLASSVSKCASINDNSEEVQDVKVNMPLSLKKICLLTLKLNLYPESKDLSHNAVLDDSELLASSASKCASINDNSEEVQDVKLNMPFSLKKISINAINKQVKPLKNQVTLQEDANCYSPVPSVISLKELCLKTIINIYFDQKLVNEIPEGSGDLLLLNEKNLLDFKVANQHVVKDDNVIKTLCTLCIEKIQKLLSTKCNSMKHIQTTLSPQSLKTITFKIIQNINIINSSDISDYNIHNGLDEENFTIDCVNTLSEEAYHNLEHNVSNIEYTNSDDANYHNFDDDSQENYDNDEEQNNSENNWLAQVQVQELRSCFTHLEENNEQNVTMPLLVQVKLEPEEDASETIIDTSIVKSEPLNNLNEMTMIPESIVTKSEITASTTEMELCVDRRDSASYDVDTFESFVLRNKIKHSISESNNDEIFTQSMFRVRRQFEPDYEDVNDLNNSLLVPQTFEPLSKNAKGCLMESSGDEGTVSKKLNIRKKIEKRKTRTKKTEAKSNKNNASTSKDKPPMNNDIAIMTRRMREKIRKEGKKVVSSDSENETISLNTLKEKRNDKKSKDVPKESKNISTEELNDITSKQENMPPLKNINTIEDEIQCNAVDSTEKLNEVVKDKDTNIDEQPKSKVPEENMYNETNRVSDHFLSAILDFSEPAEMVECEPAIPIFDNVREKRKLVTAPTKNKPVFNGLVLEKEITKQPKAINNITPENPTLNETMEKMTYSNRDGWHCYPINATDVKLHMRPCLILDKLPEAFVETYFRYQDITERTKEDEEVDRLTNLSTLARTTTLKDGKPKSKQKVAADTKDPKVRDADSRVPSPANSEHFSELTPSEDEGDNVDIKQPVLPLTRQTENYLAKNSLMDDNDSDSENQDKIKEEPPEDVPQIPRRPGPKSKTRVVQKSNLEDLMLTADKMMNKELTLLHTPVVLQDGAPEALPKISPPKPKKTHLKAEKSVKERIKAEEDSSSEEEKQWVNTKEKLLKRMGKKEDAIADDAKRAKLVSEFITKRNYESKSRTRRKPARTRRSMKKLLEKQKQLRVLSKELLGEPAETAGVSKTYAQTYAKGRRNIRKVIDKKSLATSTVIANMEEFERKRRLNAKQNRLRELLGCEEGVNVLVINDEVCLEYDFEEERPVVTVHPFFTKVMKAHQYEGVKFMWDACFESLEMIESGHPGGGCILAHCMGLGKTLQVLALLHTVLTHPRVGMSRVLVCCPLSTVLNWVDEIHKWIGPVTNAIKVFELSKLRKTYERAYQLEDWYNGGGIFIIGYELFRSLTTLDPDFDNVRPTIINKIRTALLDPGPDIIVCDEGHLLKNDCSVLAVAMSRVVTKRRIILTGTPMQNNLREYYCMVNFVKPNLLGKYSEYSNRFENPIMNGQHRDSSEEDIKLMKARTHILHKVLEGCLQRQEVSVLYPYLPKKHEYTVFISLTKCQWDLYKYYIEKYGRKSKQSILKDFHILQKIWSHPQVLHNFQIKSREEKNKIKLEKLEDDLAREDLVSEDMKPVDTEVWWLNYLDDGKSLDSLDSSNKFVAVFRILEECNALGDKVLIFSTSLFSLDGLEYFLKKINNWSLGQEYYRLDGSVPAEVRQKWCREFNAENNVTTKLFLISTRAGCLGLNMTAANRVIILDTSWNPAHDIQSIFRVYRFGQKKDCYIYRLVALGTMEQKIYERSVTKQAVACRVVDEQQIDRHYNMAELTELYRYDEMGASVASGVAVGVEDVALLRVARDAAVHAVYEHDSLLRDSCEQGLPEHERNAAWVQFQQEHAHKQMQNDLQLQNELQMQNDLQMQNERMKNAQNNSRPETVQISSDKNNSNCQKVTQEKPKKGKKGKVTKVKVASPSETTEEVKSGNTDNSMPPPESSLTVDEIEDEPYVDDIQKDADYVPEYTVRDKNGRKYNAWWTANVADKTPTPKPDTVPPLIIDKVKITDEDIIQKVVQILKEHNFRPSNEPHKPGLIDNVKNLIFGGGCTFDDPLSNQLARFMIQKGLNSITKVTHFICEAVSRIENNQTINETDACVAGTRKRGRPKKLAANSDVDTPSTSAMTPVIEISVIDNSSTGKRETRSKREIKLSVVKVDKEVIGFNSKTLAVDIPNVTPSKEVSKPVINAEESIILSDDDDDDAPLQTLKAQPDKQKEVSKKPKTAIQKEDEKIPLHPSLLTNKHFIKIVAHTYLDGNKMLDEDAAILAAQYSTGKALQEYKATGKCIDSGAIYNIALQVLGPDFLRKVNLSNPQMQPAPPPEPKTFLGVNKNLQSTPNQSEKVVDVKKPGPLSKKLKTDSGPAPPMVSEPRLVPLSQLTAMQPVPAVPQLVPLQPVSRSGSVVPVGLFRNANATVSQLVQPTHGECILPDDDDVHIINDEPTIVGPSNPIPTSLSAVPVGLVHTNRQPLVVNSVTSTPKSDSWGINPSPIKQPDAESLSQPGTRKRRSVKIADNINEGTASYPPAAPPVPPASDMPICLDSDEDEAITPHINPPPMKPAAQNKPVTPILTSLRAVGPDGQMIPVLPHTQVQNSQPIKYSVVVRKKRNDNHQPAATIDPEVPVQHQTLGKANIGQSIRASTNPVSKPNIPASTAASSQQLQDSSKSKPQRVSMQAKTLVSDKVLPLKSRVEQRKEKSPEPEQIKSPEPEQIKSPEPEQIIDDSSSSSNSSRSASPFDPLSIFKNVVHIKAADADDSLTTPSTSNASKKAETQTTITNAQRSTIENKIKSDAYSIPSSSKSSNSKSTASVHKSSVNTSLHKNSVRTELKKTKDLINRFGSVINDEGKKVSAGTSTKKTIDLTKLNTISSSSLMKGAKSKFYKGKIFKKLEKPISGIKVVGTTKNLVFSGKAITTKNGTPSKQVAANTSDNKALTLKFHKYMPPPQSEKKRPSVSTSGSAPKRQKFSSKMTLKDFNIDDIDDIIELE